MAEWGGIVCGAAYAVASFGAPWWLILGCLLAGVACMALTRVFSEHGTLPLWCALWTALVVLWLAWLRWEDITPWHWLAFGLLAGPAGLLAVAGLFLLSLDAAWLKGIAEREAARVAGLRLGKYAAVFEDIQLGGVTATAESESGSIRVVELRLPKTGKTNFESMVAAKADIERSMGLRHDAVRFERDTGNAQHVTMFIVETDVLSEDVPIPDLPPVLTVNEPLPLGVTEDGETFRVLYRELALLIVGVTGSGKSNLLNVLIAYFSRCEDVILFLIDFKGGRLAAPWIRPWCTDREVGRPAIDWVATTREEADVMLHAAERWLDARTRSLAGGSKIVPDKTRPQLVILMDEAADITGRERTRRDGMTNTEFDELIARIIRKQRSEAIMAGLAVQRGISDQVPSAIKSQCKLRYLLPVSSEIEARSVTDDPYAVRMLAALPVGSVLATMPGERKPLPVKVYRLDPATDQPHGAHDLERIDRFAREAALVRPLPDAVGLAAMGEDWERRWERTELYKTVAGEGRDVIVVPERVKPAAVKERERLPQADVNTAFTEITAGLTDDPDMAGPQTGEHPARLRLLAMLADRPHHGLGGPEAITALRKEGLSVAEGTMYRWLREWVKDGTVTRHGEGKGCRWKLARGKSPGV